MRASSSIYTNYLREDLLPLSKAPNPEHPFKDPSFKVVLFAAIGDYSRYWRDKGYSININGEVVPEVKTHSTWLDYQTEGEVEYPVKDWQMIADALYEYYKPEGNERI